MFLYTPLYNAKYVCSIASLSVSYFLLQMLVKFSVSLSFFNILNICNIFNSVYKEDRWTESKCENDNQLHLMFY